METLDYKNFYRVALHIIMKFDEEDVEHHTVEEWDELVKDIVNNEEMFKLIPPLLEDTKI